MPSQFLSQGLTLISLSLWIFNQICYFSFQGLWRLSVFKTLYLHSYSDEICKHLLVPPRSGYWSGEFFPRWSFLYPIPQLISKRFIWTEGKLHNLGYKGINKFHPITVKPITIRGTQLETFPHLHTYYLEENSIQNRDR